jgi:hypothetical protein
LNINDIFVFSTGFMKIFTAQKRRDCTGKGGEIAQEGGEIVQKAIF